MGAKMAAGLRLRGPNWGAPRAAWSAASFGAGPRCSPVPAPRGRKQPGQIVCCNLAAGPCSPQKCRTSAHRSQFGKSPRTRHAEPASVVPLEAPRALGRGAQSADAGDVDFALRPHRGVPGRSKDRRQRVAGQGVIRRRLVAGRRRFFRHRCSMTPAAFYASTGQPPGSRPRWSCARAGPSSSATDFRPVAEPGGQP